MFMFYKVRLKCELQTYAENQNAKMFQLYIIVIIRISIKDNLFKKYFLKTPFNAGTPLSSSPFSDTKLFVRDNDVPELR